MLQIFRVAFPQEVRASEAKCQRSQTTGELAITIPKVKVNPILATARKTEKMAAEARAAPGSKADPDAGSARTKKLGEEASNQTLRYHDQMPETLTLRGACVIDFMLELRACVAQQLALQFGKHHIPLLICLILWCSVSSRVCLQLIEASKAVSLTGITRAAVLQASAHDSIPDGSGGTMLFKEHTSTLPRTGAHSSVAVSKHISTAATSPAFVDDEDVPPLE